MSFTSFQQKGIFNNLVDNLKRIKQLCFYFDIISDSRVLHGSAPIGKITLCFLKNSAHPFPVLFSTFLMICFFLSFFQCVTFPLVFPFFVFPIFSSLFVCIFSLSVCTSLSPSPDPTVLFHTGPPNGMIQLVEQFKNKMLSLCFQLLFQLISKTIITDSVSCIGPLYGKDNIIFEIRSELTEFYVILSSSHSKRLLY